MKKILLTGALVLAISGIAAARGMYGGMGNHSGRGHGGGCGGAYRSEMYSNNPEMQKSWITIEEKNLDLKKELIKDKPDWKKVEKLNTEIATERAKLRTNSMKYMRENPLPNNR